MIVADFRFNTITFTSSEYSVVKGVKKLSQMLTCYMGKKVYLCTKVAWKSDTYTQKVP